MKKHAKTHHKDSTHVALVGIVSIVAVIGLVLLFITLAPFTNVGKATEVLKDQLTTYEEQLRTYSEELSDSELAKLADTTEKIRKEGLTTENKARLHEHTLKLKERYSNNQGLLNAINALGQAQNQQAVANVLQKVVDVLAKMKVQAAIHNTVGCSGTSKFRTQGETVSTVICKEDVTEQDEVSTWLSEYWYPVYSQREVTLSTPSEGYAVLTCEEAYNNARIACAAYCAYGWVDTESAWCSFGVSALELFNKEGKLLPGVIKLECTNEGDIYTRICSFDIKCECTIIPR